MEPVRILTPEAAAFIAEWNSDKPYIQAHTSGSTGSPKPIRLCRDDMLISARATLRFFGLGEGSMLLLPLPPDYIAGKMQIVRALEARCSLWTEEPSRHPFETIDPDIIPPSSMAAIVPAQIEGLLASPASSKLGTVIIGGAAISKEQEERLIENGVNAWATYGMTETCSHVALRRVGTDEYRGLPGFRFSTDAVGCLTIESDTMSFGRVVTNDIVTMTSGGSFIFRGRRDNVINSGGIKIHPEELEREMQSIVPAPFTVYFTSRPSREWGEEVVAVTDWPYLDMACFDTIEPRKRPKAIIHLDKIPRTESGKIIRRK